MATLVMIFLKIYWPNRRPDILSLFVYAGLKSDDDHRTMDWIDVFSLPHAHLQLQFTCMT